MKLQKIAAGARAFSLPLFLEKALGSRLRHHARRDTKRKKRIKKIKITSE